MNSIIEKRTAETIDCGVDDAEMFRQQVCEANIFRGILWAMAIEAMVLVAAIGMWISVLGIL